MYEFPLIIPYRAIETFSNIITPHGGTYMLKASPLPRTVTILLRFKTEEAFDQAFKKH